MAQDLAQHVSGLDCGDDRHAAAAARACQDVKGEDPPHQVRPPPIARFLGRIRLLRIARILGRRGSRDVDSRRGWLGARPLCGGSRGFAGWRAWRAVGHGARPCLSPRGQDAVVEDQVDAWTGGQGGERLQQLDRREEQVGRAVVPFGLEGDQDEAVGRRGETLLRHRRAKHVATEALDAGAVVGRHRDVRVKVKALEVCLARRAGRDPGGVGLAAEPEHAGAGARPERDSSLDRGAADAGERGRLLGERVDIGGVIHLEPPARKQAAHAAVDRGEQPGHLLVARRLGRVKLERAIGALGEDAVQKEGVEMDVQLKAAPEALDHRHRAAPATAHARTAGPVPIETEHCADGDAEDRAAELVVPGEEVAHAVGQAEHPLAHRDVREDVIDQVCRLLRHAAAATTRTEAASFAREGHEALVGAVVAPHAREASAERAAGQELPELALDETGKAPAVGAVGDLAQERFQVVADDAMEDRALRGPGLIRGGAHGRRASEACAVHRLVRRTTLPCERASRTATGI